MLPCLVARELPGLRLRSHGVKEERDRRPRWLGDYSYSNLNIKDFPIDALSAMKYGWALDRLIKEVVIADPALGPVYVLNADVSNGFYRIGLKPTDAPKLGLVFLSDRCGE